MNILMIPHNASNATQWPLTLGETTLVIVGVGIVVWICRKIVEKWL